MKKIKENLEMIIITSILTAMPALVGVLIWNRLPDKIATHFNFQGVADGWSSKSFAVFGLSGILLALHLVCAFSTGYGDETNKIPNKLYRIILWIVPAASIYVSAIVYANGLGYNITDSLFLIQVFIGILFIVLGNYAPKARRNNVFGIRIPTTMKSEKNWYHTHRFAAYVMVIEGFSIIIGALTGFLLKFELSTSCFIYAALLLLYMIIPVTYSYIYYLRHKNDEDYYS